MKRRILGLLLFGLFTLLTAAAPAQDTATSGASTATPVPVTGGEVDQKVQGAKVAANNAWMLTSCALVLFMTAPALAMFYGGLVRKKNVLGVMMQCIFLMGMLSVVWAVYGYSFAFSGSSNKYIGSTDYLFMRGLQTEWQGSAESGQQTDTPMFKLKDKDGQDYDVIPLLTHMLFQGMFFIITPALICGAFAERMKFSTMVVFTLLWGTLIYVPLAHWVWGGGMLAYGGENSLAGGALDFAGGTVVHISSGVSALICALLLGRRLGYGNEQMPPHNLTYTVLGAAMLWVGWFGFNAGSELASDGIAANAFAATHLAAAAGALAWAGMEWITRGKPSVLGAASGVVAGLVCITPASGYVTGMSSILLGIAAGIVCFLACTTLKTRFGYDDSLDAFGVHGIGGTLGAILTGVFATRDVTDPVVSGGKALGVIEGGQSLIIGQLAAVAVTWVLAIVGTTIILKVLDAIMGLRVTEAEERRGLDISQHGEEGYIFN
jgi:Amt family ammonium transporter